MWYRRVSDTLTASSYNPMSTNMAAQAVFGTTELLEAILTLLPLPTLLSVHAVCRSWEAVVQKSSVLQQKLFFHPAKEETVWLVNITNLPAQQLPLPRHFRSSVSVRCAVPHGSVALGAHHGLVMTPCQINPLFLRNLWSVYDLAEIGVDARADRPVVVEVPLTIKQLAKAKRHRICNMFLTQPPVCNVSVEIESTETREVIRGEQRSYQYDIEDVLVVDSAKLHNECGVRFKQVIAEIEKMGMRNETSVIKIYMNGVLDASGEEETNVAQRTKDWLETEVPNR